MTDLEKAIRKLQKARDQRHADFMAAKKSWDYEVVANSALQDMEDFLNDVEHNVALLLESHGVAPGVSTGICGGTTYGYGKLDNNGYWEYMLKIEP